MSKYKEKYTIGEVLDNDTQKRSKKYGYRVGRECYIILLEEGKGMIVEYSSDKRAFRTNNVKKVDQTDYGFWVETKNRTYRLDKEGFYK